jgi:predicted anti-sigma-YlaC factor YlaD
MLIQLPEVRAFLDRALDLDEGWDDGALHEFAIVLAGAESGLSPDDVAGLAKHYDRALELTEGTRPGLFVAWAETVSISTQDAQEFRIMLQRALAVDPDDRPEERLTSLISQRRAEWLLERIDELFLDPTGSDPDDGAR